VTGVQTCALPKNEYEKYLKEGIKKLEDYVKYLKKRKILPNTKVEVKFKNENVTIGNCVLAGNVDRMEFVSDNEIIVTDLKTGDAYESFDEVGLADYEKIKLHFYKYQLAFYSLLIENSRSYSKYKVRAGNLEFVESNKKGVIVVLPLSIDEEIKERLKRLIAVVCEKIHKLDFPDTTQYPNTFKGILQFEEDLLSGKA
jgi:phosphohistidine swiveling domain-containing protein